jgi:nucleobase:cation symporter-1, NCS1 family
VSTPSVGPSVRPSVELVELDTPLPPSRYLNDDLAPTPIARRTWNAWHVAALWVGLSVCIPTYMLAAALIQAGMNWWQSLATIFIGNFLVLLPMIVNAHAGTRYGIPFPVYARASFGLDGAHVPALLRSIVACGWFGIQTWVGGLAISEIGGILWPAWRDIGGGTTLMGQTIPAFLGFGIFWLINMYFVWAGTESIKWLETVSAPFLILVGLALLWWAAARVGGLGVILERSDALVGRTPPARGFLLGLFLPWVTAMVGFWATLALNIPDLMRYAKSQKDQAVGQAVGLLTTMPLFAFIGIAVTSATVIIYGEAVWNPIDLIGRLTVEQGSPLLGIVALVAILVATLTTSIAANIVGPANSITNLAPRRISFRVGGLIAALIGIAIMPWKLLDAYQGWLITYSGLLGAVGGVVVCDYLFLRRGRLELRELYAEQGVYRYRGGINPAAMIALVAGIAVAMLGLVAPPLRFLFDGAWFTAAGMSGLLYYVLMRRRGPRR